MAFVAIVADGTRLTADSDEALALRTTTDLGAFSELYSRYLCRVYGFMRSQTPSDAVAEDLTAQTFFRALSSATTFTATGSYRSWLFRIAHNNVSSWRTQQQRRAVAVEELPESIDPAPSPASIVVDGEQRTLLWRLVSSLPPAQREVIALRYLEDLSISEIGEVTSRTKGAVRILLHRARTSLRRALEEGRASW